VLGSPRTALVAPSPGYPGSVLDRTYRGRSDPWSHPPWRPDRYRVAAPASAGAVTAVAPEAAFPL